MPVNFPEIVSGLQFRQRAMKKEQDGLLQQNIEALELRQDISGAEVKRRYSALVSKDKENIEAFNRAIKQHNPVIEGEFPIMTNKLNLILRGMDSLDMPHIEGFGTRTVALNNSAVKSSDGSSSQQITTIHYLRPKF